MFLAIQTLDNTSLSQGSSPDIASGTKKNSNWRYDLSDVAITTTYNNWFIYYLSANKQNTPCGKVVGHSSGVSGGGGGVELSCGWVWFLLKLSHCCQTDSFLYVPDK